MNARPKDTLLLVGDAASDRAALRSIFESQYYLLEAENADQGALLLRQNSSFLAAVLADIPLSKSGELKTLIDACTLESGGHIPLLALITPIGTGENEEYAFLLGASDVVQKPYTTLSILRRVQVLADLYCHQRNLEAMIEQQNETILNNHQIMIDVLSATIEYRSAEAGNHVLRIRRFTKVLLEEVSRSYPEYGLTPAIINGIASASSLHDIGKISIPDHILNKPSRLTAEEYEVMKTHTVLGSQLISKLKGMGTTSDLRYMYNIALYHHERWDGGGYPEGLRGDDIPICAQVVGLTDAFDALTNERVYKQAYSYETAVNMILNGECGVFSPRLLECFKRVRSSIVLLAQKYADGDSTDASKIPMTLPRPEPPSYPISAPQLSQTKYQALLHYLDDTVIEIDLNSHVFHVVYNPNPDFISLFANISFRELGQRLMQDGMHPEDAAVASEKYAHGMLQLFHQGAYKYSFRCRMYCPPHDDYRPYEITLQRLQTSGNTRMMLVIFHRLQRDDTPTVSTAKGSLLQSATLYDLSGVILCCLNDEAMTILEGSSSLTSLTGYSPGELWTLYNNSLVALAAPEHRNTIRQTMQSLDIRSGKVEFEFRIRCKDGVSAWVQCRSRANIGPDGREYRYLTLTDISRLKRQQQSLEAAIRNNAIILEHSGGIVFEWNLKTDELHCSARWKERFGFDIPQKDFFRTLHHANHFHPDDLPLLFQKADAMRQGQRSDMIDLRIANDQGRYFWSRIRATTVNDADGAPDRVVGIVYDIDNLKTDAISMRQKAQRDELTGLLNKHSMEQEIRSYLHSMPEDTVAAMLMLDLDNFKTVNDSLGHYYGDAVLKQVGTTLRTLFRSHDAVGRIGGDEFMILLKDIPDASILKDRCRLLVHTFYNQLRKLTPNLPISVSVGAVLVPQHGKNYQDLYRRADEALYAAKRLGKNQHMIFDPLNKQLISVPAEHTTRIDSDFQVSLSDNDMTQMVFQRLHDSLDLEETIQELLGVIGQQFNVSRVYIFESSRDGTHCSNTFEWCNIGIRPEIRNLQNISYADINNWPELFDKDSVLYCSDITELSNAAREILEPQGVRSLLQCAILDRGVFKGFIGFDECTANHLWTQGQIDLLRLLSQVFSVFLTRLRTMQQLEEL